MFEWRLERLAWAALHCSTFSGTIRRPQCCLRHHCAIQAITGRIDSAAFTRNHPALPDFTGIGADPS